MTRTLILLEDVWSNRHIQELERNSDVTWIALSRAAEQYLSKMNISYRARAFYKLHEVSISAHRLSYQWQTEFWERHKENEAWRAKVFTYQGMDVSPLIRDHLFRYFFVDMALTYRELEAIVARENPVRVIYVPHYSDARFPLEVIAKERGFEGQVILTGASRLRAAFRHWRKILFPMELMTSLLPTSKHQLATPATPTAKSTERPVILFLARVAVHLTTIRDALRLLQDEYDVRIIWASNEKTSTYPDLQFKLCQWSEYRTWRSVIRSIVYCLRTFLFVLTHSLSVGTDNDLLRHLNRSAEQTVGLKSACLLALLIEQATHAAAHHKPSLVMLMDETSAFAKAWALVSAAGDTPTLDIQHGRIGYFPWRNSNDIPYTKFAAFGESSKQLLVERGVDPERIVVTGPVRYDRISDHSSLKPRPQVLRDLDLDPDGPLVVFTSQPVVRTLPAEIKEQVFRAVVEAVRQIPGCQLVVKLHPTERKDHIVTKIITDSEGTVRVVSDRQYDLYDLLAACDVMVTMYSTTIWEAVLLGKAVLCVDLLNQPDLIPAATEGAALVVRSEEDVAPVLRDLLTNRTVNKQLSDHRRQFIQRHMYSNDGQAADRVANLAKALIHQGQTFNSV